MSIDRRRLFRGALGLSAASIGLRSLGPVSAAEPTGLAPLRTSGLDPLEVYLRMFASLAPGGQCAWWFMGALPRDVDDVGPVASIQEETVRVHRTLHVAPDRVDFIWKEAGVFRDIVTGENPPARFDPATGVTTPADNLLGGDGPPARVSVRRSGDGLAIDLDIAGNTAANIRVGATIDGDRVCLTHLEDKTRANPKGGMAPTNTTSFKIYASLRELRSRAPAVAASGYYAVKNRDTGRIFVNGLMHKAALDEKLNPIAWDRIRRAHPAFFKGDRLGPDWPG
jgi:hypothetical protein